MCDVVRMKKKDPNDCSGVRATAKGKAKACMGRWLKTGEGICADLYSNRQSQEQKDKGKGGRMFKNFTARGESSLDSVWCFMRFILLSKKKPLRFITGRPRTSIGGRRGTALCTTVPRSAKGAVTLPGRRGDRVNGKERLQCKVREQIGGIRATVDNNKMGSSNSIPEKILEGKTKENRTPNN